jgi:hypothetical protein
MVNFVITLRLHHQSSSFIFFSLNLLVWQLEVLLPLILLLRHNLAHQRLSFADQLFSTTCIRIIALEFDNLLSLEVIIEFDGSRKLWI